MTTFTVVRLGGAALIWADVPLGAYIAARLDQVLETLDAAGAEPVVIDLVRVPMLDGSIVGVLAAAADRAGRSGRALELRLAGGHKATVRSPAHLRLAITQVYPSAA
jgi:hypothetical protein